MIDQAERQADANRPERAVAPRDDATRADMGLTDVETGETHRVHEHAGSAIVTARKPQK